MCYFILCPPPVGDPVPLKSSLALDRLLEMQHPERPTYSESMKHASTSGIPEAPCAASAAHQSQADSLRQTVSGRQSQADSLKQHNLVRGSHGRVTSLPLVCLPGAL